MGEAVLGVVLENLNSFVKDELAIFLGVKQEIQRLSNSLTLIQAVLEDAEQKQITDNAVKIWLQQLKDAAHVLEDILDLYTIQSPVSKNSGSSSKVRHISLISSFKPKTILSHYHIGKRLKEITKRMNQIAKDRKYYVFIENENEREIRERPNNEVADWRKTSAELVEPKIYGRDEDKEKIVEFLTKKALECHHNISVFPIVGMGGIGKTTLTQSILKDERVVGHFGLTIWVCVSDVFTVTSILQSIVEFVTKKEFTTSNIDVLQSRVQEELGSKRFLLVLDDVWNKEQRNWDQLRSLLPCGLNGSSILVSTRDSDVASIMGTHPTYHLSVLSDDDCWQLFKQRAFIIPGRAEREELVEIGKEIVKKCDGLPLAAKALGDVMRFKNDVKQWLEVRDSQLWNLKDANLILPALRLSYFSLAPTVRRCFSFCAIFSKDEIIKKEDLIHLWMANGFISSREKLEVEEVGNEVWDELFQKSFFQDVKTNVFDGTTSFKMHDLVHDLAQSIMGKECLVLENGDLKDLSTSTHHVSCSSNTSNFVEFDGKAFTIVESLRTLLNFELNATSIHGGFPTNCSLRALSMESSNSLSFGHMRHLRYLNLSLQWERESIPVSICCLQKLESLKVTIRNCEKLCLPRGLTRLENLRHLVVSGWNDLVLMPPNIGKLCYLRTLSDFNVGCETGHKLAELGKLNLGGRLRIQCLENVGNSLEAEGANLKEKRDLWKLELEWSDDADRQIEGQGVDVKQIMDGLQPHPNLKRLIITNYRGLQFPFWMGDSSILSSLVYLLLDQCNNCLQLSGLGKLPSLKELRIFDMKYVRYIDDECYDGVEVPFKSLELLRLSCMPNLEMLLKKEEGNMFPRLSRLEIDSCSKLTRLPCIPSLHELRLWRFEEELLRSVSNFHSLISLELFDNDQITSLTLEMLSNLTCLKEFIVSDFSKIKELRIELKNHQNLQELRIASCTEMESISNETLESLCSLQTLTIEECTQLKSLPEAIRHLTSLQHLTIEQCPLLKDRCEEGSGEDWHKIQHIPNITISMYPL